MHLAAAIPCLCDGIFTIAGGCTAPSRRCPSDTLSEAIAGIAEFGSRPENRAGMDDVTVCSAPSKQFERVMPISRMAKKRARKLFRGNSTAIADISSLL
jgi:hypothetical protein